jgi:molybdenum cofactor cytidylyltransferase
MTDIALVVLAAGQSRRMGGPNKLLMAWKGEAVIRQSVKPLLALRFSQKIMVTGRDAAAVVKASGIGDDWLIWHNPMADTGMSSSIICGLKQVMHGQPAMIVLGDMPNISADVIDLLLAAWLPAPYALVPSYKGQWGNPVILGPQAILECLTLTGDRGARAFLLANQDACRVVETDFAGILLDLDTPSDFSG